MPEDDGREQDGDPDGDPACVEVLVVVIMIFEVAGWRSRLHGIPQRYTAPLKPQDSRSFAIHFSAAGPGSFFLDGAQSSCPMISSSL